MTAEPAIETAPRPLPGGLRLLLGAPTVAEFDSALAAFGAELAPAQRSQRAASGFLRPPSFARSR